MSYHYSFNEQSKAITGTLKHIPVPVLKFHKDVLALKCAYWAFDHAWKMHANTDRINTHLDAIIAEKNNPQGPALQMEKASLASALERLKERTRLAGRTLKYIAEGRHKQPFLWLTLGMPNVERTDKNVLVNQTRYLIDDMRLFAKNYATLVTQAIDSSDTYRADPVKQAALIAETRILLQEIEKGASMFTPLSRQKLKNPDFS